MPTKAIRFSEKEDKAIKDFIEKNPYFDFSTIARMAILNFIEKPEIKLKPTTVDFKQVNKKRLQ
ncbi:hypothetical protein [Halobacteriovorax sp. ZH5_bin.2]|uniref:hypothetical protein n=1 Tax=Halobacteriovorax sp. ZH5_bin.2 TaxID=3157727 RepID=UPI003724B0BA